MRYLKTILILCCSLSFAQAQLTTDNKRVADVYFINKEYYAASEYYKRALQISPDSAGFVVPYGFEKRLQEESPRKDDYEYAVFQLATSLRLYKNFKDAERWYVIANSFSNPKYALSGYWYAECLRANFKFDEAIAAFTAFVNKYNVNDGYKEKARAEIESCRFALNEIKYPRLFKLTRLPAEVNTAGSNYAPAVGNQTFYFTSSRPVRASGKNEVLSGGASRVVRKDNPYINAIYATSAKPESPDVEVSRVGVNVKQMEVAAPTLHPNGGFMYFTAWINKDDKKRSIYVSSRMANNQWSDPVALGGEINVNGFNSMQPYITKDGKYLIFASDRPGGFGKYDLWYAIIRPDGTTGNAMNMGDKINTREDEQAPYYNPKTRKLLFSSNGRIGIGGFDFYESEGGFGDWTTPKNMGYPFNSAKDDMYFTPTDDEDREGYISSDRESLCCLEIFKIKREILTVSGKLIDCATLKPLEGATVTISGADFAEQTTTSDQNGMYRFGITSNRGFQVNAVKDSYFAKNINYGYEQLASVDTLKSAELCLTPFKVNKPIVLNNIFYEFDSAELTDSSKVTLNYLYDLMVDNKNIEIELGAHTDNIGTEAYNLDLSNRRAKSCVDYLVSRGIAPERMTSKGYGFSVPVAPNKLPDGKDNPAGRALNRRTEFKVTKK